MEFGDKLRRAVAPLTSYPGVIAALSAQQLHAVGSILTKFSERIAQHSFWFGPAHILRGIDALFSASAAFACRFVLSQSSDDLAHCFACIEDSVRMARSLSPHGLQYCSSSAFNLMTYFFKEQQYETCIQLFPLIRATADELKQTALLKKTYRLQALSLIALGRHDIPDFIEVVKLADDRSTLLYSWVSLHPPADPRRVSVLLDTAIHVTHLIPCFALHGRFDSIPGHSPFRGFYPPISNYCKTGSFRSFFIAAGIPAIPIYIWTVHRRVYLF
jgi:hypothetical protein